MTVTGPDRRTGGAAVTGGLLLAASLGAELIHPVQERDGTIVAPLLWALVGTAWSLGAASLFVALLGLRRSAGRSGAGRAGGMLGLIGTGLLVAFGLVALGSGLRAGAPLEASFLAFALGLLLVAVAAPLLGVGLRRMGAAGGWWVALPVATAGALVALLAEPVHDLGMFVFFGSWVALGLGVLRARRSSADVTPSRIPVS
jgi:hypothetical protein